MFLGGAEDYRNGTDNNRCSVRKFISDSVGDETPKVESDNELFRSEFGTSRHAGSNLGNVFQFQC